jgi:hypothetical protein
MATHNTIPVTGRRYAELVIVEEHPRKNGERRVLVRCDCGVEKVCFWQNVKAGKTKTCGCGISRAVKRRCTYKSPPLSEPLSEVKLAWAAGYFDGEGHTGVTHKRRSTLSIMIQIGSTDLEPLERFKDAVGGAGSINGPYQRDNPDHREYWQYSCSNFEGVQHIMAVLWKYLSEPKRSQMHNAVMTQRGDVI